MRLIGTIQGSKEAYQFYSFLQGEGIECNYESTFSQNENFQIWIVNENEVAQATHWFQEFNKNPNDSRFENIPSPTHTEIVTPPKPPSKIYKLLRQYPLTYLIMLACFILFIWDGYQTAHFSPEQRTPVLFMRAPLFTKLAYDMPQSLDLLNDFFEGYPIKTAEDRDNLPPAVKESYQKIFTTPVWRGFYGIVADWPMSKQDLEAPKFIRLRQGEIWRLLTPCFLHEGILHIVFNMLWFWMLSRQIEARIKKWQYLCITIIIGTMSNTLQYLMNGPFFVGYSGIICGLAGFIWARKRYAPWEYYPLQQGTLLFLAVFVLGMLVLQSFSFILMRFHIQGPFSIDTANTAHISGAIIGAILGRIPILAKSSL